MLIVGGFHTTSMKKGMIWFRLERLSSDGPQKCWLLKFRAYFELIYLSTPLWEYFCLKFRLNLYHFGEEIKLIWATHKKIQTQKKIGWIRYSKKFGKKMTDETNVHTTSWMVNCRMLAGTDTATCWVKAEEVHFGARERDAYWSLVGMQISVEWPDPTQPVFCLRTNPRPAIWSEIRDPNLLLSLRLNLYTSMSTRNVLYNECIQIFFILISILTLSCICNPWQ